MNFIVKAYLKGYLYHFYIVLKCEYSKFFGKINLKDIKIFYLIEFNNTQLYFGILIIYFLSFIVLYQLINYNNFL